MILTPPPPPKDTVREKVSFWSPTRILQVAVALLLISVLTTGIDLMARDNQSRLVSSLRSDMAENRAELCRIKIALEIPLSENCLEPGVVQHYNPDEQGSDFRTRISYVLCFIATQTGATLETACG